jgi:hypothetical protein
VTKIYVNIIFYRFILNDRTIKSTLLLVALRSSEQDRPASVWHGTETELRGTMNRTGFCAACCLDRQYVSRMDASNIANCLGNRKGLTACHVGSVVACRVC